MPDLLPYTPPNSPVPNHPRNAFRQKLTRPRHRPVFTPAVRPLRLLFEYLTESIIQRRKPSTSCSCCCCCHSRWCCLLRCWAVNFSLCVERPTDIGTTCPFPDGVVTSDRPFHWHPSSFDRITTRVVQFASTVAPYNAVRPYVRRFVTRR